MSTLTLEHIRVIKEQLESLRVSPAIKAILLTQFLVDVDTIIQASTGRDTYVIINKKTFEGMVDTMEESGLLTTNFAISPSFPPGNQLLGIPILEDEELTRKALYDALSAAGQPTLQDLEAKFASEVANYEPTCEHCGAPYRESIVRLYNGTWGCVCQRK